MPLHGLLILAQLLLITDSTPRGRVETLRVPSTALGTDKEVTVYLPPTYDGSDRRYPTILYLHGAGGNERTWIDDLHIDAVADSLMQQGLPEAILVMPDGDIGYWIDWVSPEAFVGTCSRDTLLVIIGEPASRFCVNHGRYETYIIGDVLPAIDERYRTLRDPAHRAIAGYSMGGYGAFSLALRHPDLWGAAVSHSGTLEPLFIGPHPYDGHPRYAATVQDILDTWPPLRRALFAIEFGTDTSAWWARAPLRQVLRLRQEARPVPSLYFDVGSSDRFADQSRALADTLAHLGVPRQFAEWPGDHNMEYWRAHGADGLSWLLRRFVRAPPLTLPRSSGHR